MQKRSAKSVGILAVAASMIGASSAVAALIPNTTLQPTVWFDAGAITGVAEGGNVASWTDSSGNNFNATQTNAARQPTYRGNVANGLPVVRFNVNPPATADEFLSFRPNAPLANTAASKLTMFIVANDTGSRTGTNVRGTLVSTRNATNQNNGFTNGYNVNPTNAGYAHLGHTTPAGTTQTTPMGVDDFNLIRTTRDGLTVELSTFTDTDVNSTTQTWSGFTLSPLTRGTDIGTEAGGSYFFGDIAEIIAFDENKLSDADKVAVTNYLGNKYGITYAANAVVPEPTSIATLGIGSLLLRRRRTV